MRQVHAGVLMMLAVMSCTPDPGSSVDVGLDGSADDMAGGADAGADSAGCPSDATQLDRGAVVVQGVGPCVLMVKSDGPSLVEVFAQQAEVAVDGRPADEPGWHAPVGWSAGTHELDVDSDGTWTVTLNAYGPPVAEIDRERSLVWVDPAILEDPSHVGLGRLMGLASGGDDPGRSFAALLGRFATTAHSERVGPVQFLESLQATHGSDPSTWDLDALPFVVTAVHNRSDLAGDDSCGELRVSLASVDPIYQPFHAIFLFRQSPGEGDVSPGGTVHCGETLRRWARLSELDAGDFEAAAREILEVGLTAEAFILLETVEFIVSPWEWRQWMPTDAGAGAERTFENPPMFQTVDTERLNLPGAARDDFLAFVADNAAALDARALLLPERFRPQSARVNAGVPWVPLDLSGIDAAVLRDFPDLRGNIEIVGCPACHSADAEFVQTRPDRTFSPFYDKELDARAAHLLTAHAGEGADVPFGPLQEAPVLP